MSVRCANTTVPGCAWFVQTRTIIVFSMKKPINKVSECEVVECTPAVDGIGFDLSFSSCVYVVSFTVREGDNLAEHIVCSGNGLAKLSYRCPGYQRSTPGARNQKPTKLLNHSAWWPQHYLSRLNMSIPSLAKIWIDHFSLELMYVLLCITWQFSVSTDLGQVNKVYHFWTTGEKLVI